MGWQTVVAVQLHAGNTIINPNGVFTYSPSPGAFNLIASQAPANGTDAYGNSYLEGVVSYLPTSGLGLAFAAQLSLGSLLLYSATTEAGPWSEEAGLSQSGSDLSFITGGGAGGGNIPQSSAGITTVAGVVSALIAAGVFD